MFNAKEYYKKWYEKNKERVKVRAKKYREENKDNIKERRKSRTAKQVKKTKKYQKEYRKINPSKFKYGTLKFNYGITKEEYDSMLVNQDYKCAICKIDRCTTGRSMSVDHCHKTNKIRGLLCHKCNLGLGHFKDNIELLLIAIEYLKKSDKID